ncbi:hypothetical protein B0H63DRAFT_503725 [Podospora didyma]|uniref:Monooxygenase n=1 Tax=Podospora didyma TaxID=330526 RepID=A0AAE0K9S4_9PEZI|nr:hypothetical protein B0H63DRAFT_503725 [Podospora didyma]
MRVAVIGAGSSGLVTLKYLLTAHHFLDIEPTRAVCFEADDSISRTFAHRTYEEAELVSSKQLTTFSDLRPTAKDPDFLTTERYLTYLDDYCTHFNLWPHIKLSSPVISVRRRLNGGHVVSYKLKDSKEVLEYECDAIAGIENVPMVIHWADFKFKPQFGVGKTVLVWEVRVLLSHRDWFLCAPKRVPDPVILPIMGNKPDPTRLNVPVDSSSASLFDTAYYYDFFIKSTLWLVSGTKHGLGQWIGGISEDRYHAIFFNKSNKAMPYISAPYRTQGESSLIQSIRSSLIQVPIADMHGRHIDLAPWPDSIDSQGVVHFKNNNRPEYARLKNEKIKPDMIILATGYTQTFPFLDNSTSPASAASAYPTPASTDVRSIWPSSDPSVGFIGFVRPSFGAIPPLAEMQAQLWISRLLSPSGTHLKELDPADEPQYRLHHPRDSRINYGVDHESYAYQLALDMDSAPSFTEILSMGWKYRDGKTGQKKGGWYKLSLVWALGANFNAKFRLRGPWVCHREAAGVLVDELWDTVSRRGGFFGHITLSGLPMLVFGSISLVLYLLEPLLRVLLPTPKKTMSVSK